MMDPFSHHVVDRDPGVIAGVEAGLSCVICRERFEVYLWPNDGMIVTCQCPCVCHRHAAHLDVDGLAA